MLMNVASKKFQSMKVNGLVHRTWSNALVTPFPQTYFIPPNTPVIEANGEFWSSPYPVFATFYGKQYFQVFTLCKDDRTDYYCNVITPITEFDSTISFIDLDIDVIATSESVQVLDLDEFEQRRTLYPVQWQQSALRAREQLVQMAERRSGVFSLQRQLSFRAYAGEHEF